MPEQWRAEFLSKNGRAALREQGIPLFRFRCSNDEYAALKAALAKALERRAIHTQEHSFFPSFVFYATEWFRRREQEGPWEWNSITASLGLNEPLRLDQELYDHLEIGFRWWRRPVTVYAGKRRFLWSIVKEGGLPVGRLVGERVHALRLVLGALVENAFLSGRGDLHRYAESLAPRLPVMLRDESILGTLAEFAWWLASNRELLLSRDAAAIVQDARLQENLPFDLSGDQARAVAEALVAEGRQAVHRSLPRGIAERFLLKRHEGGTWSISRWLRLPRNTTALALRLSRPVHCRLYLRSDSGRYASIADCAPTGDKEVEIHAANRDILCPPEFGTGPLHVVAISDGREVGRLSFQGCSDVPWLFRPKEGDSDEFLFEGEGSLRRNAPVLVAATPKDFEASAEPGEGTVRELGTVEDRRLFELTGSVVFARDIERCIVGAGEADQGGLPVSVEAGPMLDGAFIGVPRVTVNGHGLRLLWRPDHAVAVPIELKPQSVCSGAGWLIATDPMGHVLYRRHVRILPASTRVGLSTLGEQGLTFTGLGKGASIAPVFASPVTKRVIPDGVVFGGLPGQPGEFLEFKIQWLDGSSLVIRVPKPGRSARFVRTDGTPIVSEVPLARLGQLQAEAWVPDNRGSDVRLHARLQQRLNRNLQQAAHLPLQLERRLLPVDGVHRLPLITLKDDIDLMFASTNSHEAYVELSISGGGPGPTPRLRVDRYEGALKPCPDGVELTLPPDAELNPAEVVVVLQPFGEPQGSRERLPYLGERRWRADLSQRGSGVWLATGWSRGVCRFRPLRLTTKGAPANAVATKVGALESAVEESDHVRRASALRAVFDRLSSNWNDPDWNVLTSFLGSLHELPVTTYDVVVQLARHPLLCAATVLRMSKADLPRVTQALEELLFMWHLVPVTAWRAALAARQVWLAQRRTLLGDPPATGDEERAELLADLGQLAALLPGYPVIHAAVRLAAEDRRWLVPEPGRHGNFEAVCQLAWDVFLRGSSDTEAELNVPTCPHPWPNRVRPTEVAALLDVPSRIEGLAGHNASLRDLYLAPRLSALFALTGQAPTPAQVLALRQARGAAGVRAQYFEEVHLAVLIERLSNEALGYWSNS